MASKSKKPTFLICGLDPREPSTGLCLRCIKPYTEGKADIAGRSLGVAIKFIEKALEKKYDEKQIKSYLLSLKDSFEKLSSEVLAYDFKKVV